MHRYLLAFEIKTVDVGSSYASLPLHCTLVHWFHSRQSPAEILEVVQPILSKTEPLMITSVAPALFGPNNTIPVHAVERSQPLIRLHTSVLEALNDEIASFTEPGFVGAGYRPHVTNKEVILAPGKAAKVSHLYCAEKIDAANERVSHIHWKTALGTNIKPSDT